MARQNRQLKISIQNQIKGKEHAMRACSSSAKSQVFVVANKTRRFQVMNTIARINKDIYFK